MAYQSGKLYYSIGEVSKIADIKQHILRFWEKEFPILRPKKTRGKNRAYRDRDIKIILTIKHLLYDEKYTLEGVRQRLQSDKDFLKKRLSLPLEMFIQQSEARMKGPSKTSDVPERDAALLAELRQELQALLNLVTKKSEKA